MDNVVTIKERIEELKLRLIYEATHSDESVKGYKKELSELIDKLKELEGDTC